MKRIAIATVMLVTSLVTFFIYSQNNRTPDITNTESVADTIVPLPRITNTPPSLTVKKDPFDSISVPLQIKAFKVDVKVIGNIATTTMDITFYNDYPRILDGEFSFPLGDGQTVSYFAMEAEGKLREASVVEKEKGRMVYETIVRKNIDPGLLERTAGNSFRARVYPIPAKGIKRIVIGFEHELQTLSASYLYYQPFSFKDKIEDFSIRAEVFQQTIKPALSGEEPINIQFDQWTENWVAEKTIKNYIANKPLAFSIPFNKRIVPVFTEKNESGKTFFYFTVQPKIYSEKKKSPAKITLLWDVSGSSEQTNRSQVSGLIEKYLFAFKYPSVELVLFSNEIHETILFSKGEDSWKKCRDKINSLIPDGGTQLGCLNLSDYTSDEFILVSDGLSNFGDSKIKTNTKPVHTICASPKADYSYLKMLANTTGGNFIDLSKLTTDQALGTLSSLKYRLISAEYNHNILTEVYPSQTQVVTSSFSMAGILKGTSSEITLNFGIGEKILHTEKVQITNETDKYHNMIPKMWAQKKLEELDVFYEANKEEIINLGKEFNIVTRNTSLIILDNVEDHITHKIVPKDPEWKKEYLARIQSEEKIKGEETNSHTEKVVTEFGLWKVWYDSNFVYTNPKTESNKAMNWSSDSTIGLSSEGSFERSHGVTSHHYSISRSANATVNDLNPLRRDGFAEEELSSTDETDNTDDNKSKVKGSITLNAWEANAPYLKALKETPKENLYQKYLSLKPAYTSTPSFFVDVSDYFSKQGDTKNALRILSNMSELELESPQLLRVLARRLQQMNYNVLAIKVFEDILKIREEEPQSYRDLGLAYEQNKEYQKAVNVLSKVLSKSWDDRFPEVEVLVAIELNHVIAMSPKKLDLTSVDKRLIKPMPCDMRIVINWDTDNCDMDLWVTDPHSEKCFYSHPLTLSGGKMTRDFTGGYGPEVFMIKKGTEGNYPVEVNYYGDRNQSISGPTTVQAEMYTNYGLPNETKKVITLRLENKSEVVKLADYAFK